jgi:hypothetical protein
MFDALMEVSMQTAAQPDMINTVLQSAPDTGEVTELVGNVVDFIGNTV